MPVLLTEWMLLDPNYKLPIDLQSDHFNYEFAKDFDLWAYVIKIKWKYEQASRKAKDLTIFNWRINQ